MATNSQPIEGSSLWNDAWVRLSKNKLSIVSLWTVVFIVLACFLGPFIYQVDPNKGELANKLLPPSMEYPLGTDQIGRDLLARILYGGQISLLVAFAATAISVTIGIAYGAISGYVGGKIDNTMMRIVDGLLALPFLIIVILFREVISGHIETIGKFLSEEQGWNRDFVLRYQNIIPIFIAIGASGWLTMSRIVRTQTASLSRLEYVEAARSLGLSHTRILFLHIIPNTLGPIIIFTTLTIPSFILYEAALSFLGLGIEPPNSSWGKLIQEGANYLETNFTVLLFPALVFSVTLFAFNFLGDGLRDALDPKASKD